MTNDDPPPWVTGLLDQTAASLRNDLAAHGIGPPWSSEVTGMLSTMAASLSAVALKAFDRYNQDEIVLFALSRELGAWTTLVAEERDR